jgi:hypothetical protein
MSGETLTLKAIEERLPGCLAKLAALEDYAGGGAWSACRHVVDGAAGLICVGHPGAGVLCSRCAPHHLRRHSTKAESSCDECGVVVDEIHGLAVEAASARLGVRDTNGRRRRMAGRVWLIGCGVCPPCWQASEWTAA